MARSFVVFDAISGQTNGTTLSHRVALRTIARYRIVFPCTGGFRVIACTRISYAHAGERERPPTPLTGAGSAVPRWSPSRSAVPIVWSRTPNQAATVRRVNRRQTTPAAAIVLLGRLGLSLLLLGASATTSAIDAIDRLVTGVVFVDGVFFVLTGLALFVLRRRDAAGAERPRLGYPLAPAAFVLGEIGIIVGAYANAETRSAALIGVGWIAAAAILFVLFFRRPATGPGFMIRVS